VKGFATSYMTGQSVNQRLAETVGLSVELVCLTFVLSVLGSILMGSVSAFWENRWPDHLVRFFAMLSLSVPGFWLGLLLMQFFGVRLGWFPAVGLKPVSDG